MLATALVIVTVVGVFTLVVGSIWWEEAEAHRRTRHAARVKERQHRQAVKDGLYEERPPRFN